MRHVSEIQLERSMKTSLGDLGQWPGCSASTLLHMGLDDNFCGAVLCTVEWLTAPLASTH